jgi:hypothetical protein
MNRRQDDSAARLEAMRAWRDRAQQVSEAAPIMLAALKEADQDFAREGFDPDSPYRAPIRAAIARAEGADTGSAA